MANELHKQLAAWRHDVGAEMMRPNPNHDPDVRLPTKSQKKNR
jgi:hypothetical protein